MTKIQLAAALCLCLLSQPALAYPVALTLFGHKVSVWTKVRYAPEELTVDQKSMLTSPFIGFEEIGILGTTGFAIGSTSDGGNACEGSLFVLSFVENAPARLDGPLDTCGPLEYKIEGDQIIFENPASPTGNGKRWVWTRNGFGSPEILTFAPSKQSGWNALRSRSIQHPSELLNYTDLGAQLTKLVGAERTSSLGRLLSGPGSIQYDGTVVIARACQRHSCDDTDVLVALDLASRTSMVALKDQAAPLLVSPSDAVWPDQAKPFLRQWRAKWRD